MRMNTNTGPMNILAQAALVAGLAANAVVPGNASAQQQPAANATGITAPEVDHGPQPDPNMPGPYSPPGLELEWNYSGGDPTVPNGVRFRGAHGNQAGAPIYLGFTLEEGSWFANTGEKGRVYTWKNNVLTQTGYRNENEIPEGVVLSLRNLQEPYMLARFKKSAPARGSAPANGSGTTGREVDHGPQADPNMPPPMSPPGLDVEWTYSGDPTYPQNIRFRGEHATRAAGPGYLGWTPEEGAWLENPDEKGRIYTWKGNVLTRTNFRNSDDIPEATVRRFRNLKQPYMLTRFGKSAPAAPAAPSQQAKAPQRGDGLFGNPDTVRDALAGFQNQAATPASGGIAGTGATVKGGVLTFTLANNAKATYKVERPAVMQNAPQPSGVTGAWVTTESNDMGILFTVQPDGSVSGHEIPAQMIQMISQGGPR